MAIQFRSAKAEGKDANLRPGNIGDLRVNIGRETVTHHDIAEYLGNKAAARNVLITATSGNGEGQGGVRGPVKEHRRFERHENPDGDIGGFVETRKTIVYPDGQVFEGEKSRVDGKSFIDPKAVIIGNSVVLGSFIGPDCWIIDRAIPKNSAVRALEPTYGIRLQPHDIVPNGRLYTVSMGDYRSRKSLFRSLVLEAQKIKEEHEGRDAPEREIIEAVGRLVDSRLEYDVGWYRYAKNEPYGIEMGDQLKLGRGVCREYAIVLSIVLNEIGFDAFVVSGALDKKFVRNLDSLVEAYGKELGATDSVGHSWVRVFIYEKGLWTGFTVDPHRDLCMPEDEALDMGYKEGKIKGVLRVEPGAYKEAMRSQRRRKITDELAGLARQLESP